jgi:hypothetical protein
LVQRVANAIAVTLIAATSQSGSDGSGRGDLGCDVTEEANELGVVGQPKIGRSDVDPAKQFASGIGENGNGTGTAALNAKQSRAVIHVAVEWPNF